MSQVSLEIGGVQERMGCRKRGQNHRSLHRPRIERLLIARRLLNRKGIGLSRRLDRTRKSGGVQLWDWVSGCLG